MTSGLHLGNDSRGGKIRFCEIKRGDAVKIRVRKQCLRNFCILDFQLLLVHSQVPEKDSSFYCF